MISRDIIDTLNLIRQRFIDSLDKLDRSQSFQSLQGATAPLKESFSNIRSNLSEKIKQPFDDRFVIAITGSSGHGKTTILNEMFPSLAQRGWLVTDVTDTTSQSLRIQYAPPASDHQDKVTVHSWKLDQIKRLFNLDDVAEQNSNDGIHVDYYEDCIDVDGTEATFPKDDLVNFRFSLKQSLVPFPAPYEVPEHRLIDKKFIQSLTTKEPASKLDTKTVITVENQSYNSLQLRVVVKDISLNDDFSSIARWSDLPEEELGSLIFVDTPGIAVSGSVKDEVLRHPLEYKSNQILLELLKNDDLDILVHLVLCGRHSDFSVLWKALEKECGAIRMDDLCERLILAINGANIYFTNVDVKKHVQEGDHFEITIEENILQKMSPRGWLAPARICFMDSLNIVDNAYGEGAYGKVYEQYRTEMNKWMEPDTVPYRYLQERGIQDEFPKNVEALCDPQDRGQGYLVRQVAGLLAEKGPLLLIKKYLIRTELLHRTEQLAELLNRYYSPEGDMSCQAAQEAIQQVFEKAVSGGPNSIQNFCSERIDPTIEEAIHSHIGNENWIEDSFKDSCRYLVKTILDVSSPKSDVAQLVESYMTNQIEHWSHAWGYSSARMPMPDEVNRRPLLLLAHSVKTHIREALCQLSASRSSTDGGQTFHQSAEDKQTIAEIIADLKDAIERGESLCRKYGVEK